MLSSHPMLQHLNGIDTVTLKTTLSLFGKSTQNNVHSIHAKYSTHQSTLPEKYQQETLSALQEVHDNIQHIIRLIEIHPDSDPIPEIMLIEFFMCHDAIVQLVGYLNTIETMVAAGKPQPGTLMA